MANLRSCALSASLFLLTALPAAQSSPKEPPREWTDPDTGHRIVRLSDEPGSQSLYFHQNAYTPDGSKLIITTPTGLAIYLFRPQLVRDRTDNALPNSKDLIQTGVLRADPEAGQSRQARLQPRAKRHVHAGYEMDRLPLEHARTDSRLRGRGEQAMKVLACALASIVCVSCTLTARELTTADAAGVAVRIDTPMDPPRWATLERQLLAANVPACREFYDKYFDTRGHLQCFVRWGANDGPDDAFENFNHWPELHALGASDEVLQMFLKGHDGLIEQYTAAKTTEVPIARQGMYYKEFIVQSDWMHHGEGLQLFNRMGLSIPMNAKYQQRARRFAGFYMDEDPEAPNYDPVHKIIRSMENGSRGPMLRKATALDWVGDPFDVKGFDALHGESTFEQFLAHYEEYGDVVGDHFLNLVATTLPTNAFLLDGAPKYKKWIVEYMDAWLERMSRNHGIIPSFVDLDGTIGGPDGAWWKNAYGWGFSPVNPVTGKREDRNRIPRALVGFSNALLVTGDQKYVDGWRTMIDAVNANAREIDGRRQYPSMYGRDGWYGWRNTPWNVGALEVWYWSQKPADLQRVTSDTASGALGPAGWVRFLGGQNTTYPEQVLERDLKTIEQRLTAMRRDTTPPERRLADNMLDYNPAATESLVQLMWGALLPSREGGLLNARLRYFDPDRKRAGVPDDVAALVSELSDTRTVVTLVNVNPSQPRTVMVQGGGYGEHQLVSVTAGGKTTPIDSPLLTVQLGPGCGQQLTVEMKRYANPPTVRHPWHRSTSSP